MSLLTASHGLSLSETGLKLIKAYEGFRPVDRVLVNGQRVVGYGHRLFGDTPKRLTKDEAEVLLKSDLEAYEDMINENVHAPLTQGQFDALVSFAYNIGPKAFLESDTLRALNNGRPLDAANGLDIWRKSTINGKTYVVDALMRRRAAEKALFLKTDKSPQPAPSVDLPPVADEAMAILSTEDALPVFTKDDAAGVVSQIPYEGQSPQYRRREDGPAGILMLSEVVDEADVLEVQIQEGEAPWFEETPVEDETKVSEDIISTEAEGLDEGRSLIADAAADISERLDALIENAREDLSDDESDWPESLITKPTADGAELQENKQADNLVLFPGTELSEQGTRKGDASKPLRSKNETRLSIDTEENKDTQKEVDLIIDNLLEDDALRQRSDSATRYLENNSIDYMNERESNAGFWMIMLTGFILLGASFAAGLRGAEDIMGEWGPLLVLSGLMIGALMVLGAVYYALRRLFR